MLISNCMSQFIVTANCKGTTPNKEERSMPCLFEKSAAHEGVRRARRIAIQGADEDVCRPKIIRLRIQSYRIIWP